MQKIIFSRHAKIRASQRQINLKLIIDTIQNPDLTSLEDEIINKIAYYKHYQDYLSLKVVVKKDQDQILIITVHPVRTKSLSKITAFIESK